MMITESFLLKIGFDKVKNLTMKIQVYRGAYFEYFDLKYDAFVYGKLPMEYITIMLAPKGPLVIYGPHKGPRYLREMFTIDTEDELLGTVRSGGFFGTSDTVDDQEKTGSQNTNDRSDSTAKTGMDDLPF
jgi:hypothetical protein